MWLKWFPWRIAAKLLAKQGGFLDPIKILSQIERFSQPSDVAVPIEILRLASVLHARGLINSQAIQHNLDWVWPYWVERQFDPHDPAFIPRAFSVSHINLTHRNWTAVGIPDCADFPIVDPAGLVTPFFDSWSLDAWIIPEMGLPLIPSRLKNGFSQKLLFDGNLKVFTESKQGGLELHSIVEVVGDASSPICKIHIMGASDQKAWCVISLRPYNPEGISFIHRIEALDHQGWRVNGKTDIYFNLEPDRCAYSDYRKGDVYHLLPHARHRDKVICDVGLATAAALYELDGKNFREIEILIPLKSEEEESYQDLKRTIPDHPWEISKSGCSLKVPDAKFQYLYDASIKSMILHSPEEVYPGPYTYKHFWFRDAAFILNAMLCVGLFNRVERTINNIFLKRLAPFGYFHSQDGEWDSNGQVLWLLQRFCELTGQSPDVRWRKAIEKSGQWIVRKRLPDSLHEIHAGLLPAGFSAEHLGPNDYYYWDDFWAVSGLRSAVWLLQKYLNKNHSKIFEQEAGELLKRIEYSLSYVEERLGSKAMPASPYRRMDTGAIGSIVASYPLQIWEPQDLRIMATINYLMKECLVNGGFFHDMSHSGVNPYLTLHMAEVLLRAGDSRYFYLMKAIADMASPTGQWPEAVHPVTKGGCMGDGQHVWASAEWVMMIRNCFVREEGDRLILFSGIPHEWFETHEEISFGPTATKFGSLSVRLKSSEGKVKACWQKICFFEEPKMEIHLPGHEPIELKTNQSEIEIEWAALR